MLDAYLLLPLLLIRLRQRETPIAVLPLFTIMLIYAFSCYAAFAILFSLLFFRAMLAIITYASPLSLMLALSHSQHAYADMLRHAISMLPYFSPWLSPYASCHYAGADDDDAPPLRR